VLDAGLLRMRENPLPINQSLTHRSHVWNYIVAFEVAAVNDFGIGKFFEVFHMH